ncbi:MAG TPA: acetyl-CoA carboxylase carboxyltransferase subunit beta [Candidatus Limiplasma sp.]|nr:acetyl-CoA carboxylase carboxyltransferase subunit beta [Candidatus Limiplasma sp.]HRX08068.1 acetyl-CoA carboxylase carboxyltransferase subunit beta [Candidatus Limiplasma sp.]
MLNKRLFKKPNIRLEGEAGDGETRQTEQDTLVSCSACGVSVPWKVMLSQDFVCPHCGALQTLSARDRMLWLCDADSFREIDKDLKPIDRLQFPGYAKKLEKTALESGEPEGVITGTGRISGRLCAFFFMNPDFIMGSMGAVVGEKITRLFEYAKKRRLPVIGYAVSGGARIQEGVFSLMQMAKTSGAVLRHSQAGLLYIVVLTHPTTGGVTASFAMEADIILAEPRALIGFAGPRVIEQTMRQQLPEGFQRAEFLLEKGFVDRIVPRNAQKKELYQLLRLHTREASL